MESFEFAGQKAADGKAAANCVHPAAVQADVHFRHGSRPGSRLRMRVCTKQAEKVQRGEGTNHHLRLPTAPLINRTAIDVDTVPCQIA